MSDHFSKQYDQALNTLTVAQLVERAQDGDHDAFGELFLRYRDCIFRVAMRYLKDEFSADDIVAATFERAMVRLEQLQSPAAFSGWLKTIAQRLSLNAIEKRKRTVNAGQEGLYEQVDFAIGPCAEAENAETCQLLHVNMNQLGELDRQTLHAHYMNGLSLQEMADQFDCPIGTIKRRLHVARNRLRDRMEPYRRMVA